MPSKPGIAKRRVAQRKLHAVIAKPKQREPNKVAGWLASLIARILNGIRGRA
jgi:hypothetical protein